MARLEVRRSRWLAAVCLFLLAMTTARAEDIESVLRRSQQQRLAMLPALPDEMEAVQYLQREFAAAVVLAGVSPAPRLRVVASGTVAETVLGDTIVVGVVLAEAPELIRRFVLCHELGHVRAQHWVQRLQLYQRFIPGEVRQEQTDAVAQELGAAASSQSYDHENDADEFAMNLMLDQGNTEDELMRALMAMGNHRATPTHPSMGQRVAHLRAILTRREAAMRRDISPDGSPATPVAPAVRSMDPRELAPS